MILGKNRAGIVSFDEENAINRHICILGKSGAGKSVAAQKMILSMAAEGRTILAIDIHQVLSVENIYPPIRKKFEEFSNVIDLCEAPMRLPLFTSIVYADGRKESGINTVGAVVDVINRTYRLGEVQQAELRKACEFCYENGLYQELGMQGVAEALRVIGGKVAGRLLDKLYMLFAQPIFCDGEDPIVPGKINIVRLGHLDFDTQNVIAEMILSYVWRCASSMSKPEQSVVFVDEFQNLSLKAKNPLSFMLTEGRKFNLQLLLCSQSLGICFSDSQQKRILQSGLMLYFKPTDIERRSIAAMIAGNRVSDYALALASLNVGEAIAVGDLLLNGKRQLTPLKVEFTDETAGADKLSQNVGCIPVPRRKTKAISEAPKPE